jgi:Arc/MetJ family transcription regulator
MRIEVDEQLMREAMRSCRGRTKRATVVAALRLLIQVRLQAGMRRLRGKVDWVGDLQGSRLGRVEE